MKVDSQMFSLHSADHVSVRLVFCALSQFLYNLYDGLHKLFILWWVGGGLEEGGGGGKGKSVL